LFVGQKRLLSLHVLAAVVKNFPGRIPWTDILKNLTVTELVKKFPTIYGSWKLITILCKGRFQSDRTSTVDEDCLGCLTTHEWWTMLNELMLWFKGRDGLLSLIKPLSWTSAMALDIP
jgi:hypothetical protein